ncbi:hypothetical protein [Nocardia sp. NPDC058666]|uniref:hypothetical protein n=1 Tax=Nocardia sp. NPDC058666 TaxID=3346587 RepID=UPI0036526D86
MKQGFDFDFRVFVTAAESELSLSVDADPVLFEGVHIMRLNELVEVRFIPELHSDLPVAGEGVPEPFRFPIASVDDARMFSLRSSDISVTTHKGASPGIYRVPLYSEMLLDCDAPSFGLAWVVAPEEWLEMMSEVESIENSTSYFEPTRISALAETRVAQFLISTILPSPLLPDHVRDIVGTS